MTHNQRKFEMKSYNELKVEAKKNERANELKVVKRVFREFGLTGSLRRNHDELSANWGNCATLEIMPWQIFVNSELGLQSHTKRSTSERNTGKPCSPVPGYSAA